MFKKRVSSPPVPQPPDENSAYIPLTRGKFALVDKADYRRLSQYNWQAMPGRETTYANRGMPRRDGRQGHILMHREILNAPEDMEVDHVNGDGLDNRRGNLRLVSRAENLRNRKTFKRNKSGFKGITFNPINREWKATINLGTFDTAEEAARAYDDAIAKLFGPLAKLNFDD